MKKKKQKLINTNTITGHNDIAMHSVISSRRDLVSAFKHTIYLTKVDDVAIQELNSPKVVLTLTILNYRFKYRISKELASDFVYKFPCRLCHESYYCECVRPLNVRIGEHIGISPLTKKKA